MRSIKKIHKAEYRPIDDLATYSPMPTKSLSQIDPFLFLNHHGPQQYPKNNNGLPFGPHPHRGMETVTFILEGDIAHKDSDGHESVINSGGVQWMTAGRGLIHAETSSKEFKKNGGPMEILQLWINLPKKLKMTEPKYSGLQKDKIPTVELNNGLTRLNLVRGNLNGINGAFDTLTDIFLCTVEAKAKTVCELPAPVDNNVLFYVIRGNIKVNDISMEAMHLVEFNNDGSSISFETETDTILLYGYAKPFNEPVIAYGPFVMNTEGEIEQAYKDYQNGKFGKWKE